MDDKAGKMITKYIEDMHSLVSHGLQPLSQQVALAGERGHAEAQQAMQRFKVTLERHETTLATRLKTLGTSPTAAVQDSVAALGGKLAGLYNQLRTEAVSKSIRDDYTFLSLCSISWLMLATTARSLGDKDTEEMAEQGYRDCARMVMDIDQLMPRLVFQELTQDGMMARDESEWARGIVSKAWESQRPATTSSPV